MKRAICVLLLASGCTPVPGECDQEAAFAVASTAEGIPAFEGQALVIRSCGYGTHCHADGIPASQRFGAPLGLDFDLRIASTTDAPNDDEAERLRDSQAQILQQRESVWGHVSAGTMPPGDVGREVRDGGPVFFRVLEDGTLGDPLPELDTGEGLEIFRNWLVCGAPVIERTQPRGDRSENVTGFTSERACAASADCRFAVASRCDIGSICTACQTDADCAHLAPTTACYADVEIPSCIAPIEATWASIYANVIDVHCNSGSCHGDRLAGNLDMRSIDAAYDNLVGVLASSVGACDRNTRVLPGDSSASLLVHKLDGETADGAPVCGDPMPLGGTRLPGQHRDAIRAWIDAGAVR